MKNPDRKKVSKLTDLPNIGKAMNEDFKVLGINHPKDLIGKDAFKLYDSLCFKTGEKHDYCVIDVFMSVISFMEGGDSLPWWNFTDKRKELMKIKKS